MMSVCHPAGLGYTRRESDDRIVRGSIGQMVHACNTLGTWQRHEQRNIVTLARRGAHMIRLKAWILAPWLAVATAVGGMATAQDGVKLDPGLDSYQAVSGVSGNLSSVGSDTLNNLMTLWAETFYKYYPNVKIQ